MKELDLDELDQAVSKLMTDAGKPKPKKEPAALAEPAVAQPVADEPTPAPVPDPAPPADPPEEEEDDKVAVTVSSSVSSKPLQITPRKQGVAMDIVRPQASPVAPPSESAARTAPTLHPTKPIEPEEPAKEEPAKEEPKPDEPPSADHEVSVDTQAAIDLLGHDTPEAKHEDHADVHKSAWPDPLEVHGFKDEPASKDIDEPETDKEDKQSTMEHHAVVQPTQEAEKEDEKPPGDEPEEKEDSQPESGTPFLTTQVEKRPLGAYADTKPAEEPAKEEPEEKPDDTPKTEQASVPVQESPKELSPEVVAVESAEPEFTPEAPEADPPEEQKEEKATDMNNLRQMSIPPQYQADQKAPSQEHRPVFDTKEYHPPLQLTEHAQHKSRGGHVFTIVLLLLIVAALVVGYFIATGSIDISRLL